MLLFEIFTYFIYLALGLIIGSFLNVVIYRMPREISVVKPPSSCPKCGHAIKAYENIPVFSYIFQGGKCRGCKEKISIRYPIVEMICGLLWIIPLALGLSYAEASLAALFSSALLAVFFIDFEHMIIPDRIVLFIMLLSIPAFFIETNILWYERLIGFAAGGGLLLLIAILAEKILKKEGMGGGDIKLMAAGGLILGWQNILLSLFVGAAVAMVVIIIMTPLKKKFPKGEQIPFGPALSIGMLICYYFGADMISWYLQIIGVGS